MSFLTMKFLLFLALAVAGYYVIPKRFQWIWLLLFSYLFYMASGVKAVLFILTTTVSTFLGGLCLEGMDRKLSAAIKPSDPARKVTPEEKKMLKGQNKCRKKWVVASVLFLNFGILAVLKYRNFAVENFNSLFGTEFASVRLLLPLGISF